MSVENISTDILNYLNYISPSFNLSALSAAIKASIISSILPFKKLSNW